MMLYLGLGAIAAGGLGGLSLGSIERSGRFSLETELLIILTLLGAVVAGVGLMIAHFYGAEIAATFGPLLDSFMETMRDIMRRSFG